MAEPGGGGGGGGGGDIFIADGHASSLLSSMKVLRENSNLCDITLHVAEEKFVAHRLVLAASSPYFSAMFTNEHIESASSHVEINGIDASALKCLLDFAYSSSLCISSDNVQTVMVAANLLQITPVVEACSNFLVKQIEVDNCLGIAAFAEMLSCSTLYRSSWQYALENFHEVWMSEEFLSTPPSLLLELIKSEHLHVLSEEEVLECVLRWFRNDEEARLNSVVTILSYVKLCLIPWSVISDKILSISSLSSNSECQILLVTAKSYQFSPIKIEGCLDHTQYTPRKSVGQNIFLYVVGGETTPGRSMVGTVERYNPNKTTWSTLSPMETARRGVGVSILNGLVYVVGGSDGVQALKMVECYDPHLDLWTHLADMNQERSSVAMASIDHALYAVGGYDGITSCLSCVECYDPASNTWTDVADMTTNRSMHDVGVLNRHIYVVGGYDGTADLASCEVYDVDLNEWSVIQDMNSPRCMAGVGVSGGVVYVVGGCDCSQSLRSVEVYDPVKNEWNLVSDMNECRSGHGVGVVGTKLYALGGYVGSASGYSSSIECYNVSEPNGWNLVGTMNRERRRFGCCS